MIAYIYAKGISALCREPYFVELLLPSSQPAANFSLLSHCPSRPHMWLCVMRDFFPRQTGGFFGGRYFLNLTGLLCSARSRSSNRLKRVSACYFTRQGEIRTDDDASFNHLMLQLLRFLRLDVLEADRERPHGYSTSNLNKLFNSYEYYREAFSIDA